uniref:DNA ligase n=1 Tax=Bacteriophage sp. TaxID=38018 RepID=G8GER3_9VIRU|nr:ATP dependent DNA ligase [Bacteriophage sp.]
MSFDTLYHKGSSGAIYSWKVWTEGADVCTEYGQVDGKKQLARKTAEAKNVDKSNATTPEEQAVLEATSMWTHRVERKYRKTLDEANNDEIFLPMLASEFEKRRGQKKDGHTYKCDVQPKLDGVRCLAYWDGEEVKLLSRGGKDYNCPHIVEVLKNVLPHNLVLDGELYLHGVGFQTITSWVKRLQENTSKIQYHVYDCVLLDERKAQWPSRYSSLHDFFSTRHKRLNGVIHLVDTYEAQNEDEVLRVHNQVVSEGYEGAIVRMYDNSEYRFAYRSKRLLKVKSFSDNEYRVVGYTTGKGRFEDCAVWVCQAGDHTFQVVSKGTMEERRKMLEEADSYVGQLLKVKYFELTDEGIPRFPVGVGFRMEEDL